MGKQKTVKDIMAHIDEYDKVSMDAPLCDVLSILRKNYEYIKAGKDGKFHKTILITDHSGEFVGKLSLYDLVRSLVPEAAKKPDLSRAYYRTLSSRAVEVADEIGQVQERFQWLQSSFLDLVKQETQKKVKDVMSPVVAYLEENDTINKAIFVMFKENVRQPGVTRDGKLVGLVNFIDVFSELLEVAGDECFLK
jgi:CBS domain-containing protein